VTKPALPMHSASHPSVFFSYARADDDVENGRLSQIRVRLERELRFISGEDWEVFQDTEDIQLGQQWRQRLVEGIADSTFFVPIITPTYLKRPFCRMELAEFLHNEEGMGRNDLVFPILYLSTPVLSDSPSDFLVEKILGCQFDDWRALRIHSLDTAKVKQRINRFAESIVAAKHRAHRHAAHEIHAPSDDNISGAKRSTTGRFDKATILSAQLDLGPSGDKAKFFIEVRPLLEKLLENRADDALAALQEREMIVPTGAAGVGCPHAYREYLDRYYVGLFKLAHPLDWESGDGKPVQIVFMYIAGGSGRSNQALAVMGRAHMAVMKMVSTAEEPPSLVDLVQTVRSCLSTSGLSVETLPVS
jgi:TIR domain/Phosphoenolpyruvate-dependent sugar phosphotransferase system, EIIA 2